MMLSRISRFTLGASVAAFLACTGYSTQSKAVGFDDLGDTFGTGITTLSTPVDLSTIPATLVRTIVAGFEFSAGSIYFNLSGNTITATCNQTASCGAFTDPAAPFFNALLFADNQPPGNQFEAIVGVTLGDALASYFDANRLVLDISGLSFAGNQVRTLATVQFASASAVPIPGALPLFATGLGALGLLGWHRKRRQAKAA